MHSESADGVCHGVHGSTPAPPCAALIGIVRLIFQKIATQQKSEISGGLGSPSSGADIRAISVKRMDPTAPMTGRRPLAREARDLYQSGHESQAQEALVDLIGEVTGVGVSRVTINRDVYSLNSLNGTAQLENGNRLFFKFHAEEGEDETIQEYYNAELLAEAGYAVDIPIFACGEPGRQILLYRLRHDDRLSDVCRSVEVAGSPPTAITFDEVTTAQRELDMLNAARMIATLHEASIGEVSGEPVHRLFRDRLLDADGARPPGEGAEWRASTPARSTRSAMSCCRGRR